MSAGSFIEACIRKKRGELASANVESAAKQHEIPAAWARYYLTEELNNSKRRR